MNEKTESQIKELKQGCLGVLIALACVPLSGWVITKMWGWYIVPFGVPQISIAHAIGIDCLITYLTMQFVKRERTLAEYIMVPIVIPLMTLLMGWVVSLFM